MKTKGRTSTRRAVALAAIVAQLGAMSSASELPAARTGILRVGELTGRDMERAYPLVAKRLERWLENQPALEARATSIPGSVAVESLRGDEGRARLESAVARAEAALLARRAIEDGDRAMVAAVRTDPARRRLGLLAQRALLVEAALDLAAGEREDADAAVRAAIALHPDGKVPAALGWDRSADVPAAAAVDALVERAAGALTRQCRVKVIGLAPSSLLDVNGFSVGTRRELLFAVPHEYLLHGEGRERLVRCDRPGVRNAELPLATAPGSPAASSLARISERQGVRSLVLVEPQRDRFKLYLFSPERAIEEIPLEAPLRVAEVLAAPTEARLPIATDAFISLFAKHRAGDPPSSEKTPGESAPALAWQRSGAEPTRWYNSTTFWIVVGGVAAGVATAVLLSRGADPVQSRPGLTIRFE